MISELFEVAMVVLFGISWPTSIVKSWKSRTTRGKSLVFLCCIFTGYICGIVSKITASNITYVFVFYVINLVMVGIDICLYFRNRALDRARAAAESR
ncbi:hypothetical protein [Feifania hominis]|nr:hypothetical protein [Feifania hominis]